MLLLPSHHEDHYLVYRIPEFVQTYLIASPEISSSYTLPYATSSICKSFPQAQFFIHKYQNRYTVINLGQGGNLISFNPQEMSASNWFFQDKKQFIYSNLQAHQIKYNITDDTITIQGYAKRYKEMNFTPSTYIFFTVFMKIFINHITIANFIKKVIRNVLMFSTPSTTLRFTRTINLKSATIVDNIQSMKLLHIQSGIYQSFFPTRYVPQSKYNINNIFLKYNSITTREIHNLNTQRRIILTQDF
jgi:hypothetical protein